MQVNECIPVDMEITVLVLRLIEGNETFFCRGGLAYIRTDNEDPKYFITQFTELHASRRSAESAILIFYMFV